MQIQNVSNQNFGMALKCYPSLNKIQCDIARKHSMKKSMKSFNILDELDANKALTNLYLEDTGKGTLLKAIVGDKVFAENFFNSPYRVLKKALKESKEESTIELIAETLKILSKDLD